MFLVFGLGLEGQSLALALVLKAKSLALANLALKAKSLALKQFLGLGFEGQQPAELPLEKTVRMPQYSRLIPFFERVFCTPETSAPVEFFVAEWTVNATRSCTSE